MPFAYTRFSYPVHRLRLGRPSTPGDSIVVEGLTAARDAGRRTRLMIIPDGDVPGSRTVLLDTPPRVVDWLVTPWLNGDQVVTVERWGRLPQPDPDLYVHDVIENMVVDEIDGVLTADGSAIVHGHVRYPPGTEFMRHTVVCGPLPALTA